jgi:8-oxo-dGTP pyrophosphatase MutT (NUDIX family)
MADPRIVIRHFTATGFVVDGDRTILHWHKKLQTWMPPGGHIEEEEEPIEALLREIEEETGFRAEVVTDFATGPFDYPRQIPPPRVILLEDIGGPNPDHQHIDLIYFCRSLGPTGAAGDKDHVQRWVSEGELQEGATLELNGRALPIAEDVRVLALDAIGAVRAASAVASC